EASILQINLVTKAISIVGGRDVSFEDLKSILGGLRSRCNTVPSKLKQYCDQVNREASPHPTTVEAVIRRLDGFLEKAKRIINSRRPSDHPIRVEGFIKGINVIQLYGLHDVEKRVIVTQVINDILKVAEEAQRRGEERAFVIVVDELNKYAPAVRSPIKRSLIEVAARGRDLRISLFGAEQFPSDIDSQVLGNTGTFVIGRMSPVELEDRVYNVFGSLKTTAERLGKGEVLVHHPVYQYPLILLFPPPLNDVVRECM
ncbi:MAG: ATP-binding protein, partial [Acidilobaceae archaeon]